MKAYLPTDAAAVAAMLSVLASVVLVGYVLSRLRPRRILRIPSWGLLIAGVFVIERVTAPQPPGVRMLAVIAAALLAMKAIVAVEWQLSGGNRLGSAAWFAFAVGWVGMRPKVFAGFPGPSKPGAAGLIGSGTMWLVAGLLLLTVASFTADGSSGNGSPAGVRGVSEIPGVLSGPGDLSSWLTDLTARQVAATVLALIGLSLVIHFGLLNLVAGCWRLVGADCRSLFRAPLGSRSLDEFWSRRWNLAFSEMTAIALYRPLRGRIGPRAARTLSFLFSGVLHELAISLPVRAGYGGPMLYFALHALAMEMESRWQRRQPPIVGAMPGVIGNHRYRLLLSRLWTVAWLLVPLPLLFHLPFLRGVVWPLIGARL